VLYSSRCELWKIADFGISADVTSKRLHVTRYSRGTAPYRAPEMSHPNATYNNRVDIWALGCIVYEAFTGLKAFETEIDVFRYTCLPGGLKLSFERLPPYLRLTLQKPLETMLSLDGNARPSAKSLIELWANIPKPNPPGGPESQCGEIYVTSQEPAPQVFSPPGFLSHEVSKKIIFVAVNILNTRLALIFAPENSSPDECIQVHAPSDGNVCWGQKRPTRPGPTLLTFSEGGRFLVFRERGSRKSFKVLDVYKFETLATIWAEAVPVAIAFSDHGHRAAVALRRDGHPPRLLEPSLPDQSESTPTVFVSGDTIEVDMAGARGNPEIFYSGKGENIFLTQWMGKEGLNGDLEVIGWNVGTRSCHTRITLATQFVRWPDEPLHLPPCYITQNYVAVQGRGARDANKSTWFIIPLEPGSTDDMAVRHDNATFAVAVPVGFVFIHGCKMELWTPPGGTATLGQMDSDVGDEALIFAMSEDQRTLMAMTKDGRLRKWKLG
jgi:Protein kinase domain